MQHYDKRKENTIIIRTMIIEMIAVTQTDKSTLSVLGVISDKLEKLYYF